MSPALVMLAKEVAIFGITQGIRAFQQSGEPVPPAQFGSLVFELGQINHQIAALDFKGPVWEGP
ncbi:MAG: hypothetical protein AAFR79_11685 [Pseudomonadota bacterium]